MLLYFNLIKDNFFAYFYIQSFPKSLKEHNQIDNTSDFKLWGLYGESCPEGTVPVRRVTEQDMLRAYSIDSFGTKAANRFPHEVCNHLNSIISLSISFFFSFVYFFLVVHKDSIKQLNKIQKGK